MKNCMVIAQVGTSSYSLTSYKAIESEQVVDSNYAFEAVMYQVIEQTETESISLILVATKDSALGSVYRAFSPSFQGHLDESAFQKTGVKEAEKIPRIDEEEVRGKYESDLSKKMTGHFGIDVSISVAVIEKGMDDSEYQKNFDIMRVAVEDAQKKNGSGWNIYFDITYGFRSSPIYIYTLINYLSRLGNDTIKSYLYYGMYDAKNEDGTTPLVNLQIVDDLLQLINAVNEFRNCGSVIQIRKILEAHEEWNIQIGEAEEETLSYAFKMFDYGTNANNLATIEKGISLLSGMRARIDAAACLDTAEKMLLMDISDDFSTRFRWKDSSFPYTLLLIRLSQWYHLQGREGNAAIAVQESITTYLMERYTALFKAYLVQYKNFPESGDLRNADNLFKYDYRNPIVNLFRTAMRNSEVLQEFCGVYEYIRENIRNVMAHILLRGEEDEPEKYREKIGYMIDFMSQELESCEGGSVHSFGQSCFDALVDSIFPGERREQICEMLLHLNREVSGADEDPFFGGGEFAAGADY